MNLGYCAMVFTIFLISVGVSESTLSCTNNLYDRCLYDALFTSSGYRSDVLPRATVTRQIVVYVGLVVNSLVSIVESAEVMTLDASVKATWTDDHLKWFPADYNGVESIIVPAKTVWLPDFAIYNSADSFYDDKYYNLFRVSIYYNGTVYWEFGGQLKTRCNLDLSKYPFDTQTCLFKLRNWRYMTKDVNLDILTYGLTLSDVFIDNGLWSLEDISWDNDAETDESLFSYATIYLTWKRKFSFYNINFLMPASFLTIMSLGIFWLPPECGEKVSFGITVLLSFTVYQIIVMGQTPASSDSTPLLTTFLAVMLAVCMVACASGIAAIYFIGKHVASPPRLLRRIVFRYLAKVVFVDTDGIQLETSPLAVKPTTDTKMTNTNMVVEDMTQNIEKAKEMTSNKEQRDTLDTISENLRQINERMAEQEKEEYIQFEWIILVKTLERTLFFLCLITVIIAYIVIFVAIAK